MNARGSHWTHGMKRRTFLGASAIGAASLLSGGSMASARPSSPTVTTPTFAAYPFGLGVASGDPLPDGVVLWTRLAPQPTEPGAGISPDRRIPVEWEVAEDERFSRIVHRDTEVAVAESGYSVHVDLAGLDPARWYFYRFRTGGEISPVGRTRTAPAPDASPPDLRFAFASCQEYEHGFYTAYEHMAQEDLSLVIHLGDYIYEYGTDDYTAESGNVRHHIGDEITTLEEYRQRYAQYKSDEQLQAAHAAFPWVVTWDDHEVENDYADEFPENLGEEDKSIPAFLDRRAAAYQAYWENMPLRRSRMATGDSLPLYRRFDFGQLASFNVLDTRQYRSNQPCGGGYRKELCPEALSEEQTMTGPVQERWLFDGLAHSRARWNVLAQQVFMAQLDLEPGPERRFNLDAWDGYQAARERILDFVSDRGIYPIVLTGDVHANWQAELKADFDDPDSATLGSEFIGTSITSGGNGAITHAPQQEIVEANPHVSFYNDLRGYVRCELTQEQWRTDYRVVPYVDRPGAPISTAASFVVQYGSPGAQPA